MILENVKPLMILYMPIELPNLFSSATDPNQVASASNTLNGGLYGSEPQGSSWMRSTMDMLLRNTSNDSIIGGYVPIPFYFFERLGNSKDGGDNQTGFMLDSVEEDISIERPDAASTTENASRAGQAQKPIKTITVINTLTVTFRVKRGSTLITLLRALWKRSITDISTAKNAKFDFFWQSYLMVSASLVDYNESNITGTDLVQIRIKLKKEWDSNKTISQAKGEIKQETPPSYDVPIRS